MKWQVIRSFFLLYLQRAFSYRIDAIMWIVNGLIAPLVAMEFWIKVSQSQRNLGMTQNDFVVYFVMLTVVGRLTQTWSAERVARDIKSGKFSVHLLRPQSYLIDYLANDLGYKTLRLATLAPFFLLIVYLMGMSFSIHADLITWLYFFLSNILGFVLGVVYQHTFALLAFFIVEITEFEKLLLKFISLINGSLIPVFLLPGILGIFAKTFYSRFGLSFPLEIILGQVKGWEIILGFGIGIFWLTLFIFIYSALWNLGVRKYTAIGI